jgi:2-aminoadipate transaminase
MNDNPSDTFLARRMRRVTTSAIMELLKVTAKGSYISFASGLPDPALFPSADLAEIAEEILTQDSHAALQYGPAEGYPPLRAWIAEILRKRGLEKATPEHILITHGSQQALDLTARAFLEPESPVLLENPTYLAALQIFDSYEACYLPIPMDREGMETMHLPILVSTRRPRLIFTLPNFQNPTGISQSLARRQHLAEFAAVHQIPLLEDDAYYDLRYEGESLPPVTALADNPLAIYTGTFSKTIAPGLRVGYLYAAPTLIARLVQLKQITDLHTNSFTQRMVLRFCERGLLDPHIMQIRAVYRARRDALLNALEQTLQNTAVWSRPDGGMFLTLTLPSHLDATALLPQVMDQGVVYVPAATCYPQGGGNSILRLNFVSSKEEAIRNGISILTRILSTQEFQSPISIG